MTIAAIADRPGAISRQPENASGKINNSPRFSALCAVATLQRLAPR
jgi:hypothetical protein